MNNFGRNNNKLNMEETRDCSDCVNWGTMNCPNSYYCYANPYRPHFKPKKKSLWTKLKNLI